MFSSGDDSDAVEKEKDSEEEGQRGPGVGLPKRAARGAWGRCGS